MKEPLIDNRGNTIKVGDKVVFNLSGEIGIGIVQSATEAIREDPPYYKYIKKATIKILVEYPNYVKKHISVVRNPKNVMVIYE